jgi:hypothetical protein
MRIGGVGTQDNTSDILTKYLQPPLHVKHTTELNITHIKQTLTNCVIKLTSNYGRPRDDPHTASNRCLPQNQQLPLSPSLHTDRPPIMPTNTNDDPHIHRQSPTTRRGPLPEKGVHTFHRGANRHRKKRHSGLLKKNPQKREILSRSHNACHDGPEQEEKRKQINPETHEMPPTFLDLIFPQRPLPNGQHSLPPQRCDKMTHTLQKKTHKKHSKRESEALQIWHRTGQTTQTNDGTLNGHIQTTVQLSQHHPWASHSQHINTSLRDKRGR